MRKLAIALLLGFIFLGKNAADGFAPLVAPAGPRVLLLVDFESTGTAALEAAFGTAGFQVTHFSPPEYAWDNTGIYALSNFDVVVHLNGSESSGMQLSVSAQQALEAFVQAGGGYIGGQWNGFEQKFGTQVNMPNLVLRTHPYPWNDGALIARAMNQSGPITYTTVPAQASHPVLAGIPTPFTFTPDYHDASDAIVFGSNPSVALMTVDTGNPGVLVRQFGSGKVVDFSLIPNYPSFGGDGFGLQDVNIRRLYVNAVNWAGSPFSPLITAVNALPAPPMDARTRATLLDLVYRAKERAGAGRPDSAIVLLRSFIASVGKFTPSKLSGPNAANLIALANTVIGSLSP